MAELEVVLLGVAVAGVFVPRVPGWLLPALAVAVLLATGAQTPAQAADAVRPLAAPLAFLLLAVPLAIMLDRLGFFAAAAAVADRGRNPRLGRWILAGLVATFLNLDAAVVLLTPLYIHLARRRGLDPVLPAFQPVLLAALASSALPISNLTNLIAADRLGLGLTDFLLHLGPASLVAAAVGWWAYDRLPDPTRARRPPAVPEAPDRRALALGLPVVAFVVVGFTAGDVLGVKAWVVALVADVVLTVMTRDVRPSDLPFGAAALAVALGVVATAAAPHLGLEALLSGDSVWARLRTVGVAMAGADTINNLPALLVGLPAVEQSPEHVWPLLYGLNFAPVFVLHGALAGLLWRATAARFDVHVGAWAYTRVGVRVGGPAVLAGLAVLLTTELIGG